MMNEEIARQIAVLRGAAQERPLRPPLLEERTRLEEELATLQQMPPEERAAHEEKRLRLVSALRELDHRLDRVEEEEPAHVRKRLIALLLESVPSARASYEDLEQRQHFLGEKSEKLASVEESIGLLLQELDKALRAHEGRFSMRGWLFGRTPRSMATHHVSSASLMAKYLLDVLSPEEKIPLLAEIRVAADQLWEERETRWSRKGFSALFAPLRERFSLLQRALEEETAATKRDREEQRAQIEEWIIVTAERLEK